MDLKSNFSPITIYAKKAENTELITNKVEITPSFIPAYKEYSKESAMNIDPIKLAMLAINIPQILSVHN